MSILDHKLPLRQVWFSGFDKTGFFRPTLPNSPIWWPILLHIVVCSLALWWLS